MVIGHISLLCMKDHNIPDNLFVLAKGLRCNTILGKPMVTSPSYIQPVTNMHYLDGGHWITQQIEEN
jgi:hypothetical protein